MSDELVAQIHDWLNSWAHDAPLAKTMRAAADRIESLTAERDEARELATVMRCDLNPHGKTILDFYDAWLRQARERAEKAEAANAALLDHLASAENVIEAAVALDQRLQEIHASPAFQGIWTFLEAHNAGYRGPNYKGQHQALQDALAAHKRTKQGEKI